jgi:hypothetical protein
VSGVILRFSYENRPMPLDLVAPDTIGLISDEAYADIQWSSFGGTEADGTGNLSHRAYKRVVRHRRGHRRVRYKRYFQKTPVTFRAINPTPCPDGKSIYGQLDVASAQTGDPFLNTSYSFPCEGTGHQAGASSP